MEFIVPFILRKPSPCFLYCPSPHVKLTYYFYPSKHERMQLPHNLLASGCCKYWYSFVHMWRRCIAYILSYPFIKSWIWCAGFCKHPLPQKLLPLPITLDIPLHFPLHIHASFIPRSPPFMPVLLSLSGPDSTGLWRRQHLRPWPQAGCLWVRGSHGSITLPDPTNKNLKPSSHALRGCFDCFSFCHRKEIMRKALLFAIWSTSSEVMHFMLLVSVERTLEELHG